MYEEIDENILKPALYRCEASGREQKSCLCCKKKFVKEEEIVELFSSSFKGKTNYAKRLHLKCFLIAIGLNFPEIFDIKEKIQKEIILRKLNMVENKK